MSEPEKERERKKDRDDSHAPSVAQAIAGFNGTAVTITAVYSTTGSLAATAIAASISALLVWAVGRSL